MMLWGSLKKSHCKITGMYSADCLDLSRLLINSVEVVTLKK